MIALLGDAVSGAMLAGLAGECQLVRRLVGSRRLVRGRRVRICGCRGCKLRVVTGEELGERCRAEQSRSRCLL